MKITYDHSLKAYDCLNHQFIVAEAPSVASIRSEIFSAERLIQHAESLAHTHTITKNPKKGYNLYKRLKNNKKQVFNSYHALNEAINQKQAITSAAEWLIDNFHIIKEQLKDIQEHLPKLFYEELPKLAEGPLKGYPRVYALSAAFIAHADSRFDPELLIQFVRAYQSVQPLTIGEIWAIAITLRIVLIENLRCLSTSITNAIQSRKAANQIADDVLDPDFDKSKAAERFLYSFGAQTLRESFLVQLIQRLRYQDSSVTPVLQWLNTKLATMNLSADDIVSLEHNQQSATNLTVRNIITSMRLISTFDWRKFFESVSLVNATLNINPIFISLDLATQDQYLHALEELAKGSKTAENDIAETIISTINNYKDTEINAQEERKTDPGYYLISKGRKTIEKKIKFKPSFNRRLKDFYTSNAKIGYSSSILVFSFFILAFPVYEGFKYGLEPWLLLVFAIIAFPIASDMAIPILNKSVSMIMGPQNLARIDLKHGVPEALSTFVVMPILLLDQKVIEEHLQQLEVHYLSNPEGKVHFALLADWKDSNNVNDTDDNKLLNIATKGISELNSRYGSFADGQKRFFVFNRVRIYNQNETKWMGWERKRGKLHEFNRLLRGHLDTTYMCTDNQALIVPKNIKYVVTLDADTLMPIATVNKLVGTMAHPLNKPRLDPISKRVVEGYGILQPRVMSSLPTRANSSIFQRLFSGPCGIDPYGFVSSDIYQDLFGEGTYTGKGIYDVDIFEDSLEGRIPENSLLSHDLFEGTFARSGFISNLDLFEDYPAHIEVSVSRMNRWARGDWQLLPWILGLRDNSVTLIGRWKMIDNLRRSSSAPVMILTLLLAWFLPNAPHLYWTNFVFLGLAFPSFISFFSTLVVYPRNINFRQFRTNLKYELSIALQQTLCQIALLLYYAINMFDAIGRTIYRLLISKHKLLEWVSAAQKKIQSRLSLNYFFRQHIVSIGFALILEALILIAKIDNEVKILASPFIILWMFSPLVAYCISLPPKSNPIELLNSEEIDSLRLIARRTWKYFTSFVTEYDNLLPPDNFQETPVPAIAHRSSPTNFGLYLLSIISAKDFTWLGLEDMVLKLENTVEVLEELPRYKGHFYNWYDLLTKEPLHPQYISSVDSGNCAAYLLVTAQACEEFAQSSILSLSKTEGLRDTLSLLRESLIKVPDKKRTLTVTLEELQEATEHLELLMKSIAGTPSGYLAKWQSMEIACTTLLDITKTFVQEHEKTSNNDILLWVEEIAWTIESQLKDLKLILPWVKIFNLIKSSDLSAASIDELEKLNSPEILGLSLIDLSIFYKEVIASLICEQKNPSNSLLGLILALKESVNACEILMQRLMTLSKNMNQLFEEMDFSFLFDPTRKLFSIGFNVDNNSLDPSYYDMLASEARVTSFIAIAKGEVPVKHWFSLGRTLTPLHNGAALLSWSGSMFEYLMPSLIMYTPLESLLDKTCRLIIEKQIQYGAEQNVPWGISESAYNIRDLHFTYQYSSFGVPGLGLKRGIAQDLVISPYSTALAAMYYPRSALDNFKRLKEKGALGSYGFYESMDFTATRLPEKKQFAIVYAYMAHHQGMSLIALANVVFPGIMRHRFHNIPKIKATELILQERTPHSIAVEQPEISQSEKTHIRDLVQPNIRYFNLPNLSIPTTHFLSNGHYTVMISTSGSGYSSCNDTAVSRWREDATRDIYGSYVFLHDTSTKQSWSATYQPTAVRPDDYEVTFTEDKAKFIREDNGIITTLEIVVSVEENAEIRRVSIKNTNIFSKEIEITSYGEVVLAPQATDVMHPAFSNLFVETEYLAESSTLIASRRPRSAKEQCLWMAHTIAVEGTTKAGIEYETDRARFLGRGHSIRDAVAVIEGQPLSNTVGPVLDPIVSLRTRINIPSGATRNILFSTMTGNSREEIIELADKYHDPSIFERASSLAWTYSQAQLHHLAIDDVEANLFQQLASNLVYSSSVTRPSSKNLKLNSTNVTGLWAHSISGDYPILLVHIDNIEDVGLVSELLHAYEYLRLKRFFFDLVIINEKANSYVQDLQIILENMVQTSWQSNVFVLRADLLSKAEKELFETAARIVLYCKDGSLTDQVISFQRSISKLIYQNKNRFSNISQSKVSLDQPALEFFNGLGGFANNGKEYVIILNKLQYTPAPWINIIANSQIGFLVSESGSGYSWSLNSRENQISTWSNDPVEDPSSEIFYILDEESKEFWTPTALPIRCENTTYISKHGQGYSSFEHLSHGIESRLTQFVSYDDPIKISRLYLKNHSNKARRLSILAYIELVLGSSRAANAPYIITEIDDETKAMFAYNPWSIDFGKRITFIDFCGKQVSSTADRKEFIGRNGNLKQPAALIEGKALSGKSGAGLDPCFAQKLLVELSANESVELTFFLGQSDDKESAINLIKNYRSRDLNLVLDNVKNQWEATLGKIEVETPDRETDFLLNRWSLYQTLTCRYLARTAFYQAGGAYGFRDQLQDVMALVVSHPEITRAQILKACAQQFPEGDVQHWWHPPSNKGVRTKCSDDSLWLPYTLHHYIKNTGDYKILDEQISFIEGRSLLSEEESAYYEPTKSIQTATVLEHCKRILDRSMKVGAHGLPLIGSGDWNDGMNMIGHKGYGESVWLGWFLYATLVNYSALVKDYYKDDSIVVWLKHAEDLKHSLETETWDGAWYKRAYFDDGTPLGSASNAECRIDSIAQSWSVISKAADIDRATKAMESVEKHLVKTGDNLLLLFTPPFDKTQHDPGYIKGYLPGIRENGGQYTHAATWTVIAFAMLGNGNKAYELFSMLNPINHTNTRAGVYKYKIEPYVVAADIYSEPPHVGRGGWSWYTGSAAWIYRTGIEWILGLTVTENTLWINPCIPDDWKGFTVKYKHGSAKYIVSVTNVNSTGNKAKIIELDGQIIPEDKGIPLIDDNREHLVNISYQK